MYLIYDFITLVGDAEAPIGPPHINEITRRLSNIYPEFKECITRIVWYYWKELTKIKYRIKL